MKGPLKMPFAVSLPYPKGQKDAKVHTGLQYSGDVEEKTNVHISDMESTPSTFLVF